MKIINANIVKTGHDVLVNAANPALKRTGGGINKVIFEAAGMGLDQFMLGKWCHTGQTEVSSGFDIDKCDSIIHAVAPNAKLYPRPMVLELLYEVYSNVIKDLMFIRTNKHTNPIKVSIPLLGTGLYSCNEVDSLQALDSAIQHMRIIDSQVQIYLVEYDPDKYDRIVDLCKTLNIK